MSLYEDPFRRMVMPSYFDLRARGFTVEEANLARAQAYDMLATQARYFKSKPPGDGRMWTAEERVYAAGGAFEAHFVPDRPPAGITHREHLSSISRLVNILVNQIARRSGYMPTCALAEVGISHFLSMLPASRSGPISSDWRGPLGTYFGRIQVHNEPDCEPPYLLPRGELWLMMAWRYDSRRESRTEWARPVGILRFEDYTDPEMIHIAKCAR